MDTGKRLCGLPSHARPVESVQFNLDGYDILDGRSQKGASTDRELFFQRCVAVLADRDQKFDMICQGLRSMYMASYPTQP